MRKKTKNSFDKQITEKDKVIADLENKTASLEKDKELELQQALAAKDRELTELNARIQAIENEKKLELSESNAAKEKALMELESKMTLQEKERELELNSVKEKYETEMKLKDETIAFYKDFKAKQSTKMVGETLEQHCEIEFNRLRMTAFKTRSLVRITILNPEVRATTFIVRTMSTAMKLSQLCLR